METRMRNKLIIGFTVVIIIGGYGIYRLTHRPAQYSALIPTDIQSSYYPIGVASQANPEDTTAITDLVVAFGSKLQSVPLSAPDSIIIQNIDDNYAAYVSSDLLTAWKANPQKAPGRVTSSPWPDRIEITSITQNADKNNTPSDTYTVVGTVIEISSVELARGGVARSYPITLTVQGKSGVWLITAIKK